MCSSRSNSQYDKPENDELMSLVKGDIKIIESSPKNYVIICEEPSKVSFMLNKQNKC